jgi:hypothetical protein
VPPDGEVASADVSRIYGISADQDGFYSAHTNDYETKQYGL